MQSVPGTFPAGLGEPINAIITVNSDPTVLVDQEIKGGLRNYFLCVFHCSEQGDSRRQKWLCRSFGYSGECLGQHLGDDQAANLGDGHGYCMHLP